MVLWVRRRHGLAADELETLGQVTKEETGPHYRLVVCSVAVRNSQSGEELISGAATVKLMEVEV